MTKIIKEMLPPDVRVARDTQDLLIECCVGEILIALAFMQHKDEANHVKSFGFCFTFLLHIHVSVLLPDYSYTYFSKNVMDDLNNIFSALVRSLFFFLFSGLSSIIFTGFNSLIEVMDSWV